jgi:hypothetical protein
MGITTSISISYKPEYKATRYFSSNKSRFCFTIFNMLFSSEGFKQIELKTLLYYTHIDKYQQILKQRKEHKHKF